jgi:hypothetical protein
MPRGYDETSYNQHFYELSAYSLRMNTTLLVHLSIIVHPTFRGLGLVIQNRIAMEDLGDSLSKVLLFGMASEACPLY